MQINYTAELRRLILKCWDDANSGRHGWVPQGTKMVTVEPADEDGEQVMYVSLFERVDDLGYPMGEVYASDTLFAGQIEEIRAKTKMPHIKFSRAVKQAIVNCFNSMEQGEQQEVYIPQGKKTVIIEGIPAKGEFDGELDVVLVKLVANVEQPQKTLDCRAFFAKDIANIDKI